MIILHKYIQYLHFGWRRAWQPIPVFLIGKSHGQRRLVGYSPQSHKDLDMTKQLGMPTWYMFSQTSFSHFYLFIIFPPCLEKCLTIFLIDFPRSTIITYCKLDGFKQQKYLLSWFWRREAWNPVIGRPVLPVELQKTILPCLFWFLVAPALPFLWLHQFSLCLRFHVASSSSSCVSLFCVCVSLSLFFFYFTILYWFCHTST